MTNLKHIASLLLALLVFSIASVNATESITYIHTDHLGSPIAATNEDGSVKWTEDYQPFGVQRTNQDSDNTTGFTGHQHDDALELTYMQARWYHPEAGRFMALDPVDTIGHINRGNKVHGFNRYGYANNNPYKYVDPDGRAAFLVPLFVFLAKEAGSEVVEQTTGIPMPTVKNAFKYGAKKIAKDEVKKNVKNVTKRPGSFRKKTVKDSWDNAADGAKPGTKQCPTCKKDVTGNPHKGEKRNGSDGWDNDHQPKWKDRDLKGMDRKEVLDEFNKDTRLRCPSCNRSDN